MSPKVASSSSASSWRLLPVVAVVGNIEVEEEEEDVAVELRRPEEEDRVGD
jgi:hypothetical protein